MKPFLVNDGKEYSYGKLLQDLNNKKYYSPYIYICNNDPYKIFLAIIHSLIHGYSIELLDGDFSTRELEYLNIDQDLVASNKEIENDLVIANFDCLLKRIQDNKEWRLSLFTSGTTGRPKKVSHTLGTLTRNVKVADSFKDDIWAFSFNPTHMAGIQVFFQSFFNQNTMVYTFKMEPKLIPSIIDKYRITHISATSTFYRNLLPYIKVSIFENMKRVTFGGEKYDSNLELKIKEIFPNAKIRNIYASTEVGSVFSSKGNVFEIGEQIQGLVKVSDTNELLIHSSLLAHSDEISLNDQWYNTGDLVEMLDANHFRFTSRISEMINVGGYKVNPLEVEETLMKVSGIIDILVKSRNNNVTGQIIVADIVKEDGFNEKELKILIKKYASSVLQEWKVPRIIKFVGEIPKTRTGKKVRK